MIPSEATGRIQNSNLEDFVAALTEAAYAVAIRQRAGKAWLDLELELWQALRETASRRNCEAR